MKRILWRKGQQVREERRRTLVELNLLENQKRKPSPTTRKRGWGVPFLNVLVVSTRVLLVRSGSRQQPA